MNVFDNFVYFLFVVHVTPPLCDKDITNRYERIDTKNRYAGQYGVAKNETGGTAMPKAKNLKHLRLKAGLTQEALAKETGFARSTIIAWETLERSIPKNRSKELAAYFGVTYNDFCKEDFEALEYENRGRSLKLTAVETNNILLFRDLPDDVKDNIRQAIILAHRYLKGEPA